MTPLAIILTIVITSVISSFVTCAMFKWAYGWKGDLTVNLAWKTKPKCPRCELDLNTQPLLQMAVIEVEK